MAEKMDALLDYSGSKDEKVVDANRKMRVGIIGCGWIADAHVDSYKRMPDVEIVAGSDLIPGKAAEFFKRHGVEGVKTDYASHKEMLDDESLQLDAVSICTYNRQHAAPTIYALQKGVHVLLEKPFTVTLDEAIEVMKAEKESGKVLSIGFQPRLDPNMHGRIDFQPPQYHRDHASGQQIRQRIFHCPVLIHFQIPQDPVIQLVFFQGRLQIDNQLAAIPFQVAAGGKHRRTGYTEMGEKQLTKILKEYFPLGIYQLHRHIPKCKSLHVLAIIARRFQGYQTSLGLHNGVTQFLRHGISIACGAGGRIADAAGGKDHIAAFDPLTLGQHAADSTVIYINGLDSGGSHGHSGAAHFAAQGIQYRLCFIGYREHPVAPLGF